MSKISASAKQAILEKALAKDGRTLAEIAKSPNIGLSTLGKWLKRCRENGAIIFSHGGVSSVFNLQQLMRLHHPIIFLNHHVHNFRP